MMDMKKTQSRLNSTSKLKLFVLIIFYIDKQNNNID
jgi:hypothetical protein